MMVVGPNPEGAEDIFILASGAKQKKILVLPDAYVDSSRQLGRLSAVVPIADKSCCTSEELSGLGTPLRPSLRTS